MLEINKSYHNFKLLEEMKLNDINSIGRIFEHEKSGARLFHIENEDDNKVFSVSFRTPPSDSTGVAHILEHSVLCGSRKFPVKEPFVELAKGSLNTFLNAMTFADKTMYPIASKNDKDFLNLMDVYLDAVFYPNIYKYPEILMQEGWHYELEDKNDEISYKGVVYNEMKGAFSSPDSILMRKLQESVFPDNAYGVESGGDPDNIPDLTSEQFLAFHKKYYHPSNSYIYLYGNMNIVDNLKFISDEYLNNFEKAEVDSEISLQKAFNKQREIVVEYPISLNEKEEDKTFLSLNYVVDKSTNRETYLAFEILEHILLGTSASPLKKALIDAELGKSVFGTFDGSILQPVFSIVVKNSNENEIDRFKKVVYDTLINLVNNGIDKTLIEASINIKEFHLREGDFEGYPKGLIYGISCMDSWLYDESPALHLEYSETFEKIKSALTTNYFEKLIQKYLLENNHSSMLMVKPKKGLGEEKAEALKTKLTEYKASLSEVELNKIIDDTKKLKERQSTGDSSRDLETIPLLSLEDIKKTSEPLPLIEKEIKGVKTLYHPIFASGILYTNIYFDTKTVPQELLPYITLLAATLGKVGTKNYTYEELSKTINIHTGGISYSGDVFSHNGSDEIYYPKFVVKAKVLVSKASKLTELLEEIIKNTSFKDTKRLKEIIQEMKSRLEVRIIERGHMFASKEVCSYFSPFVKYEEELSGLSFYKFIADMEKNFEDKKDILSENLNKVSNLIFNRNNLIVSLTCSDDDFNTVEDSFAEVLSTLSNNILPTFNYNFEFLPYNKGLMTSAKVQYAAKGYNFKRLGYSYKGSLQVLRTILSYDYLWNEVRVKGGAYGAFAKIDWNGNFVFSSYRDPNLTETINVYDRAESYLRAFDVDKREMTKYIIGTVKNLDQPLTPSMKGELSDNYYIRNVTFEDIQKERTEILSTRKEDIQSFADLVSDITNENYISVIGSEDKIKENSGLFRTVVNIFE